MRVSNLRKQMETLLLVPFTEAGRRLGIAVKTVRNWDSAGKFPVPTFLIGSRRMVRTKDLEKFVEGLGGGSLLLTPKPEPTALQVADVKVGKLRGRPRKQKLLAGGGLSNE
jgi:hypothetical protein